MQFFLVRIKIISVVIFYMIYFKSYGQIYEVKEIPHKTLFSGLFSELHSYKMNNNNLADGIYKIYTPSYDMYGKIDEKKDFSLRYIVEIKNSKYNGTIMAYDDSNNISLIGELKNSIKVSIWRYFNDKNQLSEEEYYTKGILKWNRRYIYDLDGILKCIIYFEDGKEIKKECISQSQDAPKF